MTVMVGPVPTGVPPGFVYHAKVNELERVEVAVAEIVTGAPVPQHGAVIATVMMSTGRVTILDCTVSQTLLASTQ